MVVSDVEVEGHRWYRGSPMLMWTVAALAIGAPVVCGIFRLRRSRAIVRQSLERDGYTVVRIQRRVIRQGPFLWTTSRAQTVYRVLVQDRGGHDRTVWARLGRSWLPRPDQLEFRWEGEK